MFFGEEAVELFLAVRTIIEYGVLDIVECAQKVDQLLWIHLAKVGRENLIAAWVVRTIYAIVPQA